MPGDCRLVRVAGHLLTACSASSAVVQGEAGSPDFIVRQQCQEGVLPVPFFDCVCASREEGVVETDPLSQMAFVRRPHILSNDVM